MYTGWYRRECLPAEQVQRPYHHAFPHLKIPKEAFRKAWTFSKQQGITLIPSLFSPFLPRKRNSCSGKNPTGNATPTSALRYINTNSFHLFHHPSQYKIWDPLGNACSLLSASMRCFRHLRLSPSFWCIGWNRRKNAERGVGQDTPPPPPTSVWRQGLLGSIGAIKPPSPMSTRSIGQSGRGLHSQFMPVLSLREEMRHPAHPYTGVYTRDAQAVSRMVPFPEEISWPLSLFPPSLAC